MNALGRHILAELNGIAADRLNDTGFLERSLVAAAQNAGATVVESSFNSFSPHGVTGVVIIQESHLALHTWPEHGYTALDIFTCSQTVDPQDIADAFASSLDAETTETRLIERGVGLSDSGRAAPNLGSSKRSVWFTDRQDNIALSLRHAGVLFNEESAYQKVEVLQSDDYGRILLLDNQIAFTERDEFVYHELIAHIPVLHHPDPRTVLIIGGGDGGACREFLKHPGIETITVVEIDPTVTEAARDHFPDMATCLDDARVTLMHGDGSAYLSNAPGTFDVIAVDCLDTAGDNPFDRSFPGRIKAALSPGGIAVSQVCSPALSLDRFRASVAEHGEQFEQVRPYLGFLPTYSTGMLSFLIAGDRISETPRPIPTGLRLNYLTTPLLEAVFALPAFIHE